ncbi:MAG: hypothetical protein V4526_00465 [Patescibacteria group bacterium]
MNTHKKAIVITLALVIILGSLLVSYLKNRVVEDPAPPPNTDQTLSEADRAQIKAIIEANKENEISEEDRELIEARADIKEVNGLSNNDKAAVNGYFNK